MIKLHHLTKTYSRSPGERVAALNDVSLEIAEGDYIAIIGPSGSGKSTLMNVLGLLDLPTSGNYFFKDREVARLSVAEQARFRNEHVGFVFQAFHLLPRTSALDNVALPLLYSARPRVPDAARRALTSVGLADRLRHTPSELSGGQQQRVAIARALVNEPALLLADEPTGNLDPAAAEEILRLFEELHRAGRTVILVTHDANVARRAKRVLRLEAGRITLDQLNPVAAASS